MGQIVEVDQLVKKYGSFVAVNNMSFQVEEGMVYGFLGPNGAGKSTTLSIIATLLRHDEGNVLVDGYDIRKNKSKIRNIIGWVPQEIVLYPKMTIRDNIRFYGSLYGLKGRQLEESCQQALKVVALDDMTKRKVFSLSGGMQRRLNIACGIVHNPKLIIMDEPTVGVDAQSRDLIMNSIKTMNQNGASIIYTSHYMHEVETLCREIGIVNKGQMIASGTYSELSKKYSGGSCFKIETTEEDLVANKEMLVRKFSDMNITFEGGQMILYSNGENNVNSLLQEMISRNMSVLQVASEQMSLEDIFLRLTDNKYEG